MLFFFMCFDGFCCNNISFMFFKVFDYHEYHKHKPGVIYAPDTERS